MSPASSCLLPAASFQLPASAYVVFRLAIGVLLLFAGATKVSVWQPILLASTMGATECQCLGGTGTPIWVMLGLDVGLLVALFIQRDRWGQSHPLPTGFLGDLAWSARWVVPALLLLSVFLFGTPRSAIDYVRGRSILVRSPQQFAGRVAPDATTTSTFELRNLSRQSIHILGAKASCRCVAIDDLPLTLAPQETKTIRVRLVAGRSAGVQRESAELIFDDSSPGVLLGVTAIVHLNQ